MKKLFCFMLLLIMTFSNTAFAAQLQLNSKGPEVEKVQRKLVSLGYSVGSKGVDGFFGKGTEDAVKRFQGDNDLPVIGIVGPKTKAKLFGEEKNARTLRYGDSGEDVKELQKALLRRGYSLNGYGATGNFRSATQNAVKTFQKDHGLAQTGVVDEQTRNTLMTSKISTAAWLSELSANSQANTLKRGDSGEEVRKLQEMLLKKGYSLGGHNATGYFGPATEKAVKELQKDLKLPVTGTFQKGAAVLFEPLVPHTLPPTGKPNSVGDQHTKDGELARRRFYGPDGKAGKDEDYREHGGHPTPHDHEWDWNKPPSERRGDPVPHDPWPFPKEGGDIKAPEFNSQSAAWAAALGYAAYRGVRLIPSLTPQLFWTLPANIATP